MSKKSKGISRHLGRAWVEKSTGRTTIHPAPLVPVQYIGNYDRAIARRLQMELDTTLDLSPSFFDLAGTLFTTLAAPQAPLVEAKDLPLWRLVNRRAAEYVQASSGYEQLLAEIGSSYQLAGMAANQLFTAITGDKVWLQLLEMQEQAEELQQQLQTAQEQGDSEQVGQLQQQLQDLGDALQQATGDNRGKFAQMGMSAQIDTAVAQAGEQASQTRQALGNLGYSLDGDGSLQELATDNLAQLLRELSPIIEIAHLIGRARETTTRAGNALKFEVGQIAGVGFGQDVDNIFDHELEPIFYPADHPERLETIARYATEGLLGLEPRVTARNHGAAIILVDESGSMQHRVTVGNLTTKRVLAVKAIAYGIVQAMQADGEEVMVISFGNGMAAPAQTDPDSMLRWLGTCLSGGTPMDEALNLALDTLEERIEALGLLDADILVLTDGDAKVEQETVKRWQKLRQEFPARLLEVAVDAYPALDAVRDAKIEIDNLDNGDQIAQLFGEWFNERVGRRE